MWRPQQFETVTNELAAYELKTQGKIKWRVGGGGDHRDIDIEPKLAGAYFLGPPLPLDDGQLYCLAERGKDQAIYLEVLDAKSGKVQWQQQLVSTADSSMNGFQDSYRRLTGATPSFADGVLVCPTSAGAVVAVDLATHKLLWGYEYPPGPMGPNQQMIAMRFQMGAMAVPSYSGDRWADSTATIAQGRVLITPVEGEQPLFCLSLIDGKLLWKMDRGDNVYVAGVEDGKVILVGKRKVQAVSLVDTNSPPSKEIPPTPKLIWSCDLDAPVGKSSADSSPTASTPARCRPAAAS